MTSESIQVAGGLEKSEVLMWSILRKLENLAVNQYKRFTPFLLTDSKTELVDRFGPGRPI